MRPLTLCLVLVIISSALILGGCGGSSSSGSATITGRVCDDGTRSPLLGISVVIPSRTETTTDADGVFQLTAAGASSLSVAGTDYETKLVSIPAGSGDIDLGIIYLVPAPLDGYGNISGTIVEAGLAVQGAKVTCADRTSYTDSNGHYTLYNVPAGVQTVNASNPSRGTGASANVTVSSLSTSTVSLQLTTMPPPPPIT